MINQEIIIIVIALIVVLIIIGSGRQQPTPIPRQTQIPTRQVITTTPSHNKKYNQSYGDMPGGSMGGGMGGRMDGGMDGSMGGGMGGRMDGGMGGGMGGMGGGMGGMGGGMDSSMGGGIEVVMNSLQNLPQSIRTILEEVGYNQPTKSQLERLEKALRQYIPNPKALVAEIRNVPKDSKGMPQISKEKLLLYMLMISLFINSGGKFFKEEVGEDVNKSYGAMPGGGMGGMPGMKGNIQKLPQSIRTILEEIGDYQPTNVQLKRLEGAIRQYIPNLRELVSEIRSAPIDSKGLPQISEEKLLIYLLMTEIYFYSEGKFFYEELGIYAIGSDLYNDFGNNDCKCTMEYNPVNCNGTIFSNICHAYCAGQDTTKCV